MVPMNLKRRRAFLREIREKENGDLLNLINGLLRTREDGRVKLFLIYRALKSRNECPEVFRSGAYIPLEAAGRYRDHLIAFARNQGKGWAITIVPRFLTTVTREGEDPFGREVWEDTHIPLPEGIAQGWKNMITDQKVNDGRKLIIGEVLTHFPVALLMREETVWREEQAASFST